MFNKLWSIGAPFAFIFCFCGCDRLLFYPTHRVVATPNNVGLAYQDIYLSVKPDIALHGWRLPAQGQRKGTILFFHGNGENISTHFASIYWLPARGYEVFLFDYRGYGISEGEPDVKSSISDAELQIKLLTQKYDVELKKLVVFGQSFGGAVAINAVARLPNTQRVGALIVDSSFAGFRRIVRDKLGDTWLTWPFQWPLSLAFTGDFESLEALRNIRHVPIVVIHSKTDEIIPFKHGEKLFQAANEPRQFWVLENAHHIESMSRKDIREKLILYLETLFADTADTKDEPKL